MDFRLQSFLQGDIRPRVKSYGERDMPLDGYSSPIPKLEEAVTLKVHGIVEAGLWKLNLVILEK